MKVISTNIGEPKTIQWNGKEERTGIFKYPIAGPLYLGSTDVDGDTVIDRKHHAGVHKACFLFSADQYPYWKSVYPNLAWDWGMFGENLTVAGLDESLARIGDVYQIGGATVQISMPREPCYKLGIRFADQAVLKQYVAHGFPGTYLRVLKEGSVRTGDEVLRIEQSDNPLTVQQCFQTILARRKNPAWVRLAISNEALPQYKRDRLLKYLEKRRQTDSGAVSD